MAFKFKISKVQKLSRANIDVVDGTVLAGQVTTGQDVVLVHGDTKVPLRVTGVALDSNSRNNGAKEKLSLTFKRHPSLESAEAGDVLMAA